MALWGSGVRIPSAPPSSKATADARSAFAVGGIYRLQWKYNWNPAQPDFKTNSAMDYKITCPKCGTKLSRWHYFSTMSIYYRCRSCNAQFRMTTAGWLISLGVVALEIGCFVLYRLHFIPAYLAIDLLLIVCSLAVWLLPFVISVKLKHNATVNSKDRQELE
jgi:hypothetical protein